MATKADPRRSYAMARSSGHAHADIYPSDSKCALALGIHRATANRYRKNGGRLQELADYVTNAPDTFRIMAHLESWNIQKRIKNLPTPDLTKRYHEVLQEERDAENDDSKLDVLLGSSWLDRARASERDAAINLEKSGIEREFAARGVTEAEVWRRGR